jgi:hypothetical protein
VVAESVRLELTHGDVYRRGAPMTLKVARGSLGPCIVQRPSTYPPDHPTVLEHRNEVVWRDDALSWMLPAKQSFDFPDADAVKVANR